MTDWRSRIVGITHEPPEALTAHPLNPKLHPPAQQAALRAALSELGWITGAIVNDRTGHILDGHDRRDNALATGQPTIPVIHVDVDEAEEPLVLATFDPIARLAEIDQDGLQQLLERSADSPPADPQLVQFLATLTTA